MSRTIEVRTRKPTSQADVIEIMTAATFAKKATIYNKWLREKAFPAVQGMLDGRDTTINAFKNLHVAIIAGVKPAEGEKARTWKALQRLIIPKIG